MQVPLGIGSPEKAVVAHFAGIQSQCVVRCSDGRALEVARWRFEERSPLALVSQVSWFGGDITQKGPGGRDFFTNPDGTISPTFAPRFVLGIDLPRLILVPRGSANTCVFEHAGNLRAKRSGVPLTLANLPGVAVVPYFRGRRANQHYSYIYLALGPASDAIGCRFRGGHLISERHDMVFDCEHGLYSEGDA
jgi:hypothetical protein